MTHDVQDRPKVPPEILKAELCQIVRSQYGKILTPVLLTQLVIAAAALGHAPTTLVAAWAAAVALVHGARYQIRKRVLGNEAIGVDARVRAVVAMSLASGLVHASAVLFLPYLPAYLQTILYVLLLALCAGCVAVNVGHLGTVLAFVVPITTALAFFGVDGLASIAGHWEALSLAGLTLFFAVTMALLARDTYANFENSVSIQLRLAQALTAAESASRAKTRFLAAASHDLRQPLHTMSFLTATLEMRPLDDKAREIVRNLTRAVEDLSSEFDMLLDISKLDAGVVPVNPTTFELGELLERVSQPFRMLATLRGLDFQTSWPLSTYVRTDRGLLERILRNLLDNAFKYTRAGSVRIEALVDNERCILRVVDTGIGIPEAEQERVFEEFYQLDNPERDRRKGLGLGLHIVRRLAELLKIGLTLGSKPGIGTTVTMKLAVAPVPPQELPVARPATSGLGDLQLLIIEDEVEAGRAMQRFLEAQGCQVSIAATINEATAIAQDHEPDLVVADFRLRGAETGLQAIEALRRTRPQLPALLITGDTAPERLAEMNASRIPLLHKPVQPGVLVDKITSLLSTA